MKTVVIYSGGLDSTVLLYWLKSTGHEVKALSVNYGQKHKKELDCARELCIALGVDHRVVDLSEISCILKSALTKEGIDVPEGEYETKTMKTTVVPNRNMILLALATAMAISEKFEAVSYAAHAGDHEV